MGNLSIVFQEFQAAKKEGSGFMSRWADSFHNMSASYMMKNRHAEYGAMNDYIHTFSDKLGVLDRISQRILKERYGGCFVMACVVIYHWSKCD